MSGLTYDAPHTVRSFMDSDAFCRLIVGPIGSGKSSGCVLELLQRAMAQTPGPDGKRRTRWAIIRNTYRELNDTTRATFSDWLQPLIAAGYGKFHEQSFTFHLSFNDVEAEFLFRALNDAADVKKLLSLELTGAYLNEWREIPIAILAGLKGRVGRFPSMANGGPTWHGIFGDTNPMPVGSELYKLFKVEKPDGHEVFEQPSGLSPKAENVENLVPGYYATLSQGQESAWVDEYVKALYPLHDKGSVYGELMAALESVGAVGKPFAHPTDSLYVNFDLGMSDATAMWWWRPNAAGGVDFLDYYEASGKPLSHFVDELKKREDLYGWTHSRLVLPHDARNRVLTGNTVAEQMEESFPGKVDVLPNLPLEEGLSAFRWLLERLCRFHSRCDEGVKVVKAYRYEFDLDRRVFSRKPIHDWTSHGADSGRYVATYVKRAQLLEERPVRPAPFKAKTLADFTLDEFYAINRGPSRPRRMD